MKVEITAIYNGKKIKRYVYSRYQAWVTIDQLAREGCKDISVNFDELDKLQ